MKRSALVLGLVTAMLVPASIAVAQSDEAPVAEQTRLGDGNPEDCPYYQENGEPQMLRLHEGEGLQTGAGWGQGSADGPHRAGYGHGECDGECEGFGAGPRDGSGPLHEGSRDGTGNQFGRGQGGNGQGGNA